ncbi:MAG: phospholipase D-like domain-containing protein [bacterium]
MEELSVERQDRLRAALRRNGLVRRPEILRRYLRRHGLRFTEGNRVHIFATGDAGLAAMLTAIEGGTQRIHLETYILRADAIGRRFLAALTHKARGGVSVRVIYDAVGSLRLDPVELDALRDAGGQVLRFNPLRHLYPQWLPRRRDHRKILVVDGRVGFTGGLNIGDEYNAGPGSHRAIWRDTHLQVEGPAVQDLEAVFLESWFRSDGSDLPWGQMLGGPPPAVDGERVSVVADGPSYRHRVVRDLVLLALATARRSVCLTSPYFAPDVKVLSGLARAARRGVAVTLLLAGRTDHPILRRATRSLLPRLLDAGVVVYEVDAAMLHAKTTVLDDIWAMAGTSNLDRQSFERSYEVNLVIEGGDVPRQLAALFDADIAAAIRLDAARLARRTLPERLLDRICALVLWIV